MKKISIILLILIALVVVVLGFGIYKFNFTNDDIYTDNGKQINIHDGTYNINGQNVTLKNGISEISTIPDSASKTITRYFGNDIKHDFNKDGREDLAFILTQETGGSGVFYYVVALLNTTNGPIGSQGTLLGDRIAPQSTNSGEGDIIIVNYADRKAGESFAIQPSFGKSMYLLLDTKTMQFGEVAQNFEGEANPSSMTLGMKTWNWINITYNDGKKITPLITSEKKFTLTFKTDKTFSVTTDCNGIGGEYSVKGDKITLDRMMSTLMFCEGSQENDFSKALNEVQNYHFTSKGELVLGLKLDSGYIVFK